MSNRLKAYLALLTTAFLWGIAFPIIKPALDIITPSQFLYFRYLIAAPIFLPIVIYHLVKYRPSLKTIAKISLIEFFGTPVALVILYSGLRLTSALEASLIGSAGPIFITLGGIFFLKEREEKTEWLGLSISFIGTIILVLVPLLSGHDYLKTLSFKGNLIVIIYQLLNAAYTLAVKKNYHHIFKPFAAGISYLIGLLAFAVFLPLTGVSTSLSLLHNPIVLIASGYMAIFGSIIAFTLFLYGQSLIEASEASIFSYLGAIFAIPAVYILLDQSPSLAQLIAVVIIFIGVIMAEYRPRLDKKTG